jgi:transposase InsO family protein
MGHQPPRHRQEPYDSTPSRSDARSDFPPSPQPAVAASWNGAAAARNPSQERGPYRTFPRACAFCPTFLGIEASPSFIREPEGNGVAERFIRTLKESLLWVRHETIEELRLALLDFAAWYNTH